MKDPQMKAAYQKKAKEWQYAYHVALADAMIPPEISGVDLNGYCGKVWTEIRVQATDDFAVLRVTVEIKAADGSIIEVGEAQFRGSADWVNVTRLDNENWQGGSIRAMVEDNPGNATEFNFPLVEDRR